MATTETGVVRYRATGRDEDRTKNAARITVTGERAARIRYRSGTTVWGNTKSAKRGGQGSAGREDKNKAGATSGLSKDNTANRHRPLTVNLNPIWASEFGSEILLLKEKVDSL